MTDGDEENSENIVLKEGIRENYHFKIVDQTVWDFLQGKYGGLKITRSYIKLSQYYNAVEVFLKEVPVLALPTNYDQEKLDEVLKASKRIMLSKRKFFSDLKVRLVDCLKHNGYDGVTADDVRFWRMNRDLTKLKLALEEASEGKGKTEQKECSDTNMEEEKVEELAVNGSS